MMYSHYYICKKPNISKRKEININFGGFDEAVVSARGAGAEARGTLTRLIDHGATSRETRAT